LARAASNGSSSYNSFE
jgi:hypothetical protein